MGIPIVSSNIIVSVQTDERFVSAPNPIRRDAHSTDEYDDPDKDKALIEAIQEREEQDGQHGGGTS